MHRLNPPLTPNLQEYKQKNKSKSRRKPCSIQPTNPPTPKIQKPHITLKITSDKLSQTLHNKEQTVYCPLHPDKIGLHFLQSNCNKKFCNKCYLIHKDSEQWDQEVQTEKKKQLDEFKRKIKGFGLKLEEAESSLQDWRSSGEQNFYSQKQYIKNSFNCLHELLDQKQRQLLNRLLLNQQCLKKMISKSSGDIEEAKASINRYIEDIDINYSDIIQSLSYDQFNEIIEKYNFKLQFYEAKIEQIVMDINLNVYIPKKEIQRQIQKSSIQTYPVITLEDESQNKMLKRYTTEKNNFLDCQEKGFPSQTQHHYDSLGCNKMSQHRQSKDHYNSKMRENIGLGQFRPKGNKENVYADNFIFN